MIVRCPECRHQFRLRDFIPGDRVVKYLCPSCDQIVRIDLAQDLVKSSSSPDSLERTEGRKRVLVADDAGLIRETARRILQDAGFEVLVAENGEQALKQIREEHPDAVVLDLLMPKLTGFDVLREVKREEGLKNTPILVMSAVFKQNVLDFLHEVGVQGFLDKQNLKESLLFRVETLLKPSGPTGHVS